MQRPILSASRFVFLGKGRVATILWGLFLVSAIRLVAAETVGWKVPLESITSHGLQSPGAVRLKSLPEQSPLLGEKDELWDVSNAPSFLIADKKISQMTHPAMEWVIWNASTKRLVTKCDWREIWQLYGLFDIENQPRQHRYQLALYDSQDGRSMPRLDAKPLISWTGLGRGHIQAQSTGGNAMIDIDGRFPDANDHPWLDISLMWQVDLPGRAGIRSNVSFLARSGKPTIIAGDLMNGEGWVAVFTAVSEFTDGLPVEDAAWWIKDGRIQQLDIGQRKPQRAKIGEAWLESAYVPMMDTSKLIYPNRGIDSIAENHSDNYDIAPLHKPFSVPAPLREWCSSDVLDISEVLRKSGFPIKQDDIAGYDPKRQEMFFYLASGIGCNIFETIFNLYSRNTEPLINITLSTPQSLFLVSRDNHRSELERTSGDAVVKSVSFEPSLNDHDPPLVSTRITYESITPQGTNFFKTHVTSKPGEPLIIHHPPGHDKPWILTADITRD